MKMRDGFVSNSSSTSFIINATNTSDKPKKLFDMILDLIYENIIWGICCWEDGFYESDIFQEMDEDLQKIWEDRDEEGGGFKNEKIKSLFEKWIKENYISAEDREVKPNETVVLTQTVGSCSDEWSIYEKNNDKDTGEVNGITYTSVTIEH